MMEQDNPRLDSSTTKEFKHMKLSIMISQPMNNLSSEKIIEVREKAIHTLETFGYDVIDNFFH